MLTKFLLKLLYPHITKVARADLEIYKKMICHKDSKNTKASIVSMASGAFCLWSVLTKNVRSEADLLDMQRAMERVRLHE
jgi:hypothetical protein